MAKPTLFDFRPFVDKDNLTEKSTNIRKKFKKNIFKIFIIKIVYN
jgi:hypothetical protein